VAAATAVMVEKLGPAILGYLRALHDKDDAEDVFWLWAEDVWRGLPGFRGKCSLRWWCYRLAYHASVRLRREPWRKRKNQERLRTAAESQLAAIDARPTLVDGRREKRLEALRKELDAEERAPPLTRPEGEMSWGEIAAALAWLRKKGK
jgi:RNA polymerase sigma-70 factor (ECF subfamily)